MNETNKGEGSVGQVIALIIILAVIVLGGLYFWKQRAEMNQNANTQTAPVTDAQIQNIEKQSSSDDTTSIQNDLKATDTTNIDTQLGS